MSRRTKPSHAALLVELATKTDLRYNEYSKRQFHVIGKTVLRQLARALGLPAKTYDVRSNKGGVAVSGEVTLHTDTMYVQLYQSHITMNGFPIHRFLYRACEGRNDYAGKVNRWASWDELLDLPAFAKKLKREIGS